MPKSSFFLHDTVICHESAIIDVGTKVWQYSSIQAHVSIGSNCILGQSVNIGPHVVIGNSCKIQNNVSVYEGVTLENYVFCGPSMVFTNIMVPRAKYPQAASSFYLKTLVKEGASIGANATIVCGVTLGKHCLIGAGTVVNKDVPDFAIMVGNPARQLGWISEAGKRLSFSDNKSVFCEKSQAWYTYHNGVVRSDSE